MRQAFHTHQRQASMKHPQTSKKLQKSSQPNSIQNTRTNSKLPKPQPRQTHSRTHTRHAPSHHPLHPYNLPQSPHTFLRNTLQTPSISDRHNRHTQQKIAQSSLYKKLLTQLQNMKKNYHKEITSLQEEIKDIDQHIQCQKENLLVLIRKRDKMESDVRKYGDQLVELQQKNYQMYWDVAARINQEEEGETYEELLEMEEEAGYVSKGLKSQEIQVLFTKWNGHRNTKKHAAQNPQDAQSCCICCHTIQQKQNITLPCQHSYHGTCIKEWLTVNRVCPLCRKDVKA